MTSGVVLFAALAMQVASSTQTVIPAGDRLEVNINPRGGAIVIEGEDRRDIEVTGRHSDEVRLEVNPGRTVELHEVRPARAGLERTEYRIRVPLTMGVTVVSDEAAVEIRGVRGDVSVQINHGSARAHGVRGTIVLDASTGDLLLESSSGDAFLDTSAGVITVIDFDGTLETETVAGVVTMTGVSSSSVRVTTNGGGVSFQGDLTPEGVLDIATQRGDVELALPPTTSATFEIGTVSGELDIGFDMGGVTPEHGETFSFAVGSGGGRVIVITYSGAIRIYEAGRS